MRVVFAFAAALPFVGAAVAAPQGATVAPNQLSDHDKLLDPIQVDSLTLTPIATTATVPPNDLIVLDEATALHLVQIREKPGGEVNALALSNQSDHPLFLLAGEVIIGGQQDRIIGRNTIIPAKTTQDVPVYCVEHGRWEGNDKSFHSAKALAHGRLRGQASFAGQEDVWNEVAAKNKVRKTESSTGTYRQVAAQQSDGTLSGTQAQVDRALAALPAGDRDRVVGFAVALNGQVATVDLFSSPALFKKLQGKLVHSYLTEAIDVTAAKDVRPPTTADVKAFMTDADKADEAKSYDTSRAATTVQLGKRAYKATVEYKPASPRAATAAPAESDVYENYQAK